MATEYEISSGTTVVPTTGDKSVIVRQVLGVWTPFSVLYETTLAPIATNSGVSLLAARADHAHGNYVPKVNGGTAGHYAVLTSDGSIADGGSAQSALLPATTSQLGGVKQGLGIAIASDGTLSVSFSLSGTSPIGVSAGVVSLLQNGAATGQVLQWNGSAWVPASVPGTVYTGSGFIGISGSSISFAQNGAINGQVPTWNGSAWAPATPSAGTAISGVSIDGSTIVASTGSPYQMVTADRVIDVNKSTGAATKVMLPSNPTLWVDYTVIDGRGDAGTNNITVAVAGGTINGTGTFVMNANNDAISLRAVNATTWRVT